MPLVATSRMVLLAGFRRLARSTCHQHAFVFAATSQAASLLETDLHSQRPWTLRAEVELKAETTFAPSDYILVYAASAAASAHMSHKRFLS